MENKLPESWCWTPIVELLDENSNGKPFQQGWSPQCNSHPAPSNQWGVLKTTAIQDGEFWDHENKELPESIEPRPHLEVSNGDILMTCAGPRNRCGVVCFVKQTRPKLLMSGKMYRFRPNNNLLDSRYLEGFIRSNKAQRAIDSMKTGINDSGLNLTHSRFSGLMVPFAPLDEQRRIVAKVDALFSELDNGIASLTTARQQLDIYRHTVLKHAFEGKLTAKWRKNNSDNLESPEQLLARIQQERKEIYRLQLSEWNSAVTEWESLGKPGKAPSRPKQPISTPSTLKKVENLPKSWGIVPLEELISFGPSNGWSPQSTSEITQTKAITLTATTSGKFDGSQFKYIDTQIPKHSSLWLKKNDILVQRGNTIEYVGVPALYSGEDNQFIYPDLIMKIQASKSVSPEYLTYAMSMVSSRSYLRGKAVGAAGSMPKINQQTVASLPIPICSECEQKQIVALLDEKISLINTMAYEIDCQLKKSKTLRQSILENAYTGKLLPQIHKDEPASELLARVKAERKDTKTINSKKTRNAT